MSLPGRAHQYVFEGERGGGRCKHRTLGPSAFWVSKLLRGGGGVIASLKKGQKLFPKPLFAKRVENLFSA